MPEGNTMKVVAYTAAAVAAAFGLFTFARSQGKPCLASLIAKHAGPHPKRDNADVRSQGTSPDCYARIPGADDRVHAQPEPEPHRQSILSGTSSEC
jgi:hypothetical protein